MAGPGARERHSKSEAKKNGKRRVAIVAGLRTPFAKQGTAYRDLSALDLGKIVVSELLQRAELDPKEIGMLVYGQVVPSLSAPNIAREIVLGTGMPKSVEAFSVSRACATSIQSMTSAAEAILAGQHDVAITGGADSASDVPIAVSKRLASALVEASRAKTLLDKLKIFAGLSPRDLAPVPPALKEPSTGLTMGESAEKMAREGGISRQEQDAFAVRSHAMAARAWSEGVFADEVMHVVVPPKFDKAIGEDNLVRKDATADAMAKLRPVFDRKYGTLTAANSSPLTDGASALVLMSEEKAKALGYEPLGYLRSWGYAALDPNDWMLMGPSYATPIALEKAGLTLKDIDLVDMHEAFAAQVLCNVQAFASKKFAEEKLGRSQPIGEIDDAKFNVHGGSISIGHPFAATGARMVHTVLRELKRRGGQFGLVTLCAAGGLGAAAVLEVS
ncbi:MAG: acetyl-CoA C-acyltransferase FadI [Deltaproteobacteria bacterium]|nr:acetyl-CoA C-acyltransferase FadI [Deltaproteobacteria bacterium]